MSTALITGATSGIGFEFVQLFAKEHYGLVLVARDFDMLSKLKNQLEKKYSIPVIFFAKDLSEATAAEEIHRNLKGTAQHIDVLINNAGFGEYGAFLDTDWEKEHRMISLNITALTAMTKLFLPDMVKRKSGYILNVASTAAFLPGPLMAVYYATKAYVLSFSEGIAKELAGTGVSVTALCPGPTESNFAKEANTTKSVLFSGKKLSSAKKVAEFGYRSLFSKKVVAIYGLSNNILVSSTRFLPRSVVRELVFQAQKPIQ